MRPLLKLAKSANYSDARFATLIGGEKSLFFQKKICQVQTEFYLCRPLRKDVKVKPQESQGNARRSNPVARFSGQGFGDRKSVV